MTSGSEALSARSQRETLACEVSITDDAARVRLVGELDLASAAVVDARLDELVNEGARQLILDLSGLSFIDSSGLRLLFTWLRNTREAGVAFSLVRGGSSVQRVFSIAGVENLLPFLPPERTEESVTPE
jgi:anti-sigma B factor antagonist